ncbi:MAG: HAD-IB family hydrolase, partial [Gammaproteobacteria bacterium]|nr:HAD-IB family hydrolase [Gammaproteobacteria bacterium]
MKLYPCITAEVDQSKGGRSIAAFFDFDGTLIAGYSAASFMQRRILSGGMPPREAFGQLIAAWQFGINRAGFADVLVQSAATLRGMSDAIFSETAREVYEKDLSGNIYPEARALVDAHRAKGHTVVIVSSATQYQVQHVAAELSIEHVLCTRLEVENGALTGAVVPPVCYGEGKLEAARRFVEENGVSLDRSY